MPIFLDKESYFYFWKLVTNILNIIIIVRSNMWKPKDF